MNRTATGKSIRDHSAIMAESSSWDNDFNTVVLGITTRSTRFPKYCATSTWYELRMVLSAARSCGYFFGPKFEGVADGRVEVESS